MAIYTENERFEFELTINKYGIKVENTPAMYGTYDKPINEEQKEEVLEKLEFKSLSAKEVLRKLFDYLSDK